MSFGIKPLGDKVVIKRMEAEEKTSGGLIIASQAKEQPQVAEVIAVGDGNSRDGKEPVAMKVKVGDKVIVSKYAGTEVKIDGEDVIIVNMGDILAVVE